MYLLWAYFNPNGRLPRDVFQLYFWPIVALLVGWSIYMAHLKSLDEPRPLWLLIPHLTLLWMQACVISRRLRDCGYSGALPLAMFVILAYADTAYYFPELMLGSDETAQQDSSSVIYTLRTLCRWLYRLTCAAAVVTEGFSGDNCYGPPFGTLLGTAATRREMRVRQRIAEDFPEYVHPLIVKAMANKPAPASSHAGVQRIQGRMNSSHAPAVARLHVASRPRPARSGFGRR